MRIRWKLWPTESEQDFKMAPWPSFWSHMTHIRTWARDHCNKHSDQISWESNENYDLQRANKNGTWRYVTLCSVPFRTLPLLNAPPTLLRGHNNCIFQLLAYDVWTQIDPYIITIIVTTRNVSIGHIVCSKLLTIESCRRRWLGSIV